MIPTQLNSIATARFPYSGRVRGALFFLFAILLSVATDAFGEPTPEPHPPVFSASEIDYPPFCMIDKDGRTDGFSIELMRAVLAAMGREVAFRTGLWTEVRGWLERGEIEALPLVGRTPERELLFDFTVPYMSLHGAIVVRNTETDILDLADLRGRKVAVMKGDNAEEFLRREDRGIEIHTTPTFEIALKELADGRYDAVVAQRLVALRLIQKTGLTDLQVVDKSIKGFQQDFCFAVQEGDRDTLALLNEGLAIVVADGTYGHLHAKWFAAMQMPHDRPLVVGGDRNFPPFEFLDESGRPAGYNVDLTRAIAREMGIDVKIQLGRWPERVNALKTGKVDVLQGMFYSPIRDLSFDFTQAHTVIHYVAVVRQEDGPAPERIDELRNKRIVVESADILHDYAIENGLETQTSLADDQEAALRELADGKHDCALVSRVTALYLIGKHDWTNLLLGKKPLLSAEYCYSAAKGQKALTTQFGEGLKTLANSGEYRRIYDKWLGVYQEEPTSFLTALRYSALVIIPLLVILLVAVIWSWTLRRQVAAKTRKLQESLEKFRYVFESANVGKSMTLPTGEVNTNQAFAAFLGYTRDELKGKRWQDLTPREDINATEQAIAPLLAGEKSSTRLEKRYVHKNGGLIWADVSVVMRRDVDGTPLYFMTTVVDIGTRKQAEEALCRSEEYHRLLAENTLDVIWIMDLQLEFTYVNPAITSVTGHLPSEWIGSRLPEHCDEENFGVMAQVIADEMAKGPEGCGVIFETEMLKKNGESLPVEIHEKVIFDTTGQPVSLQGTTRDITERKEAERNQKILEAQLNQAQKMESVGRLAGGVAHDYNNALTTIMGFTELAMMDAEPEGTLHDDLNQVIRAGRQARDITRQLLAFARKQTIAPVVLKLNPTVESMLKMLGRLIGEDIDFVWLPGKNLWNVLMDPSQIDQILANLCVNARDAIEGVGKITIETNTVVFDAAYCADHAGFIPGEFVLLAVSDNGCGMDKETLDTIFEPFFTTKDVGKGTGLGLSTVYGIVKQNNGFINVYSEPGKGTSIKIYLSRHEGKTVEIQGKNTEEVPQGLGETILVVEDDLQILKLAQKILEGLNYKVLIAGTPKGAMRLASEHTGKIHLLVTDVIMPEMNGRELSEQLQSLFPDLKCIFMSGYTANTIAHHGVLDEGVHFVQKPFSKNDLATIVRKVLDRE